MTSVRRQGVTLIELLVTIGIILAITAAVIPVMAPVMEGRRLREATRGVNTFINSARNRAMVTGRPVGVAFERLEAEPQASIVLRMVETPQPWGGDFSASTILVGYHGRILSFPLGDQGWLSARVRPGDIVTLNGLHTKYRLYAGEVMQDLNGNGSVDIGEWVDSDVDNNGYAQLNDTYNSDTSVLFNNDQQTGHFVNPPDPTNGIWSLGYDDPRKTTLAPNIGPRNSSDPPIAYSFQIVRQPAQSAAEKYRLPASAGNSYQLPVGTVVDLGVSGIDQSSYFAPLHNTDLSPVILLFAPNGSIDRVWCHQGMNAGGPTASTIWGSSRPTSSVQFLVGRREAVGLTVPPGEGPDVIPNWFDLENLWIGVKSQTGAVSTNPNAAVFDSSGNPISQPFQDGDENDARAVLSQAREFARQGQSMGGN